MAKISVTKAWDEAKAVIVRERSLIMPVALALVFLPALLFRVFAPPIGLKDLMAGDYPASVPLLSYLLIFIQLVAGAAVTLLALGSSESVGATIATGFRRAVVIVLALLIGALAVTPVLFIALIIIGMVGGVPADPKAIPPGFLFAVSMVFLLAFAVLFRAILFLPAAAVEAIGPWAALKRGWQLGRGSGGRLIATMGMLFVGSLALNQAAQSVVGSLAMLTLGASSGPTLGGILVALVVASIGTGLFVIQYVLLATLYRQAVAANPAN